MIDKKDKKILVELLKDGRKSFVNLARSCRMTRQSVFSRIKSLKRKGVIKDFTVNLSQKKLGLNLKAYILISAYPSEEFRQRAIKTLVKFPQFSQIHILFGRFDFLIEVLVKDIDELSNIVGKIHKLEMISRTETIIVYKNVKHNLQHPFEDVLK
ncbi:MAG: winged helix-turn-helix transcriptional regulator [Candidatus Aenigmarchaeota archaeon]|nr:winged helix-turn-helix transcriptional regulator [Candidatus Aenigmarchaeota archaeon]